ncbi:FOXN4 [Branchiostoma lanceolatum]|uniref:FOXN4 protein n=2 Tax=Branchiostoma lanceolatum TaxID=7740 RepID=A0A8J9VBZ0_BRALA|nr:FOXN4 [Branchiostoma lanceolatum]
MAIGNGDAKMDYFGQAPADPEQSLQEMIDSDVRDQMQEILKGAEDFADNTNLINMDLDKMLDLPSDLQNLTWDSPDFQPLSSAEQAQYLSNLNDSFGDENLMVNPQTGLPVSPQKGQVITTTTMAGTPTITSSQGMPSQHAIDQSQHAMGHIQGQQQQQHFVTNSQVTQGVGVQGVFTATQFQASPVSSMQQLPQQSPQVLQAQFFPQYINVLPASSNQPLSPTYVTQPMTRPLPVSMATSITTPINHTHRQLDQTSEPAPKQPKIAQKDKTETEKVYPKPAYSYSCLIAMALKNSKTGCLPVSEIYNFMCDNFPYFKTAPDGWKNSVRHNLSLNKCFEKVEKSTGGTSKKGCLWTLNPAKVAKMEEEVQKITRKDPQAIRRCMANPEYLPDIVKEGKKFCANPFPKPETNFKPVERVEPANPIPRLPDDQTTKDAVNDLLRVETSLMDPQVLYFLEVDPPLTSASTHLNNSLLDDLNALGEDGLLLDTNVTSSLTSTTTADMDFGLFGLGSYSQLESTRAQLNSSPVKTVTAFT